MFTFRGAQRSLWTRPNCVWWSTQVTSCNLRWQAMPTELCMSSISRCCALRTMQGGPRSLCVSRQVAFDKPRSSKPTLARTRKQVVVMIASAIIPPQTPAAQGMLDLAKTLASKTDERVQIRASTL